MNIRLFSELALAGAMLSGCVMEELSYEGGSIHAEMETDQTRTAVTDEGTFTWSSGDQVWLHTTSGYTTGMLSSGEGTSTARFSFGSYSGEMTGKAVYPYNAGHDISGDVLSVVMPASYDLGSSLTNTNAAMYGVNFGGTIKFNHLAGVMRFKFKDVPAGVNKFTITLDKKINGTFTANLAEKYPVIETSSASAASEKTITLNFTALNAKSDISIYVPLPIGTYNSLELGLYDEDQAVWTYSKSVTNTVSRKSLKLMPVVTLGGSVDGDIEDGVINLSENGTANSYIVSEAGSYKFTPTKGNSNESVGTISSVAVLWETFGTNVTPNVGDLVQNVCYADGVICFDTPSTFKEGNTVIAAKDASGKILWSWHIWLTDQPQEQVYYNNAGTMMDRNLGAISATPGDVGALGLMYQWGRKDPFLGSSSRGSNVTAMSTAIWPAAVYSNSMYGTIDYAVSHPTTFIAYNDKNNDWYYTGSSYTDNTRWTTSEIYKSIYDPCPAGWRVPDGGLEGVWAKACGSSNFRIEFDNYNRTNNGIDFSSIFGADQTIWYPATGMLLADYDGAYKAGHIYDVADEGNYWSSSPDGEDAYHIYFNLWGNVYPWDSFMRACGCSVRCIKEGSASSVPSEIVNLSATKSANAYVVSEPGTYKFGTVKGNSSESVGSVASSEILWESFGTDETPQVGELVCDVSYANGEIYFKTANSFTEGNAVIAAKDASGKILWSWHIWLTDQPQEQVYYNNAGTMMDRNLGATSATPGEVGAMGLIYQWGRKDPFLGSSCIWKDEEPKSTISWPSAVSSNSSNGTIEYATANPTTFIKYNGNNYDWYYTGSSSTDNTRWTTSETSKSIYDPCPAGWRVPDGGSNSVWFKAGFNTTTYDSDKIGILFSTASSQTWYPAAGCRDYDGEICNVDDGYYWSASPCGNYAYYLYFYDAGFVTSSNCLDRALGSSVRCVKEGPLSPAPSEIVNLSATDSANSYIVSEPGTYRFSTVKGNSSESVGMVASAEVLWESFGTHETPQVGDLVREVSYANGDIYFKTARTFREGNAIIAARDASGNILWSWHIWLTDQPQEQVYYSYTDVMNVMMDRNIGATSATPGDVCALGLLYQWGRKDPFLGSSSIDGGDIARSTTAWPSAVSSDPSIGTIEYATSHPTTFIAKNKHNRDWFYTDYMETDNTRWTTSGTSKAIYDPCPVGWRVPDGGSDGVWASFGGRYSNTYKGFYFGISFPSSTWYPAAGNYSDSGSLDYVGTHVACWSASPYYDTAYCLLCLSYNQVYPADDTSRACGLSVRCVRE
ncbi:MAG: hypothetical protein SPG52_01840 [Candidatus Cryptobacteroides sp.]|nr:hypothetical protein [Candidatus Cryptobacteroides sp.]